MAGKKQQGPDSRDEFARRFSNLSTAESVLIRGACSEYTLEPRQIASYRFDEDAVVIVTDDGRKLRYPADIPTEQSRALHAFDQRKIDLTQRRSEHVQAIADVDQRLKDLEMERHNTILGWQAKTAAPA